MATKKTATKNSKKQTKKPAEKPAEEMAAAPAEIADDQNALTAPEAGDNTENAEGENAEGKTGDGAGDTGEAGDGTGEGETGNEGENPKEGGEPEADEPNVIFVGKDRNGKPMEDAPKAFRTAAGVITLPSADRQKKGFYLKPAEAKELRRTFPAFYKKPTAKG